jgi:acid phosphatase (class A)
MSMLPLLLLLAGPVAQDPNDHHHHGAPLAAPTGTQLAVDTGHWASLERLDGSRRPGLADLDRKVFDLSAMNPSYLRPLTLGPTYLKLPVSAFYLPEPPENSSERTRGELEDLLRLQATARSPQAVARAKELAGVFYRTSVKPEDADWPRMRRNLFATGAGLNASFGPEHLPKTADFMARVWSDASFYIWALKYRYNRIRPHHLEPKLEFLENANFPAYPSGHSSNSYVAALVYSELLPQHRELFLANAAELAFSREVLGVHYASDSAAGRLFADKLLAALLKEPRFVADLAAARAEIEAAGITTAAVAAARPVETTDCGEP